MKRIALAMILVLPAVAPAASVFDGTWKVPVDSLKTAGKVDVFVLISGTYTCSSCVPEIKIKADGSDHGVRGHSYYDTVACSVTSSSSIELIEKLRGKRIHAITYSVSADAETLTGKFEDYSGKQLAAGSFTEKRVATGPRGSHAVSGSWMPEQLSDANEPPTVTYQMTPESFSMHWNGQRYVARFDGKEYPVEGDPGHMTVSVKKINDKTVEETDHRNGQVVDEMRLSAAQDGKTLTITDHDTVNERTTVYTLEKK